MKKLWFGKYKWAKRILLILIALGAAGSVSILGISSYMKAAAADAIYTGDSGSQIPTVDCILVLGAGLKPDGTPSLVLTDRLNRGIELYKKGISRRLLMSGDHGRTGYNEVEAMKKYAMDAGIPEDDIFMDHAGFSTYESLYRARDIFEVKSLAIVTQPYHEYRAVYIAEELGLTAYGTPSIPTQYRNAWMMEVREMLARTKEFFNLLIQPEPTYLGDRIPIHGTGTATNDSDNEN